MIRNEPYLNSVTHNPQGTVVRRIDRLVSKSRIILVRASVVAWMIERTRLRRWTAVFLIAMAFGGRSHAEPSDRAGDDKVESVFFENEVRPILVRRCYECHGEGESAGGLSLDSRQGLLAGGDSGSAVMPGEPDESRIIRAVHYDGYEMPPDEPLPDGEIEMLSAWVRRGAFFPADNAMSPTRMVDRFDEEDRAWWAIQPIADPPAPPTPAVIEKRCRSPIDAFLNRSMAEQGLQPVAPEDPEALARRLSLDLIGLPPPREVVDSLVEDPSRENYEQIVDRLLADRGFGEHAARAWLDLVRYAESDGYRADEFRPDAWRYRDYVITSFNDDKPYDRFIREQIAADELYPDDLDAQIGLGFLRHWVYEWNIRDARTQWQTILEDITDTTADALLGLGLQCAKCHNHKFDPLLQRDYFRLRAFFEPLIPTETPLADAPTRITHAKKLARWKQATETIRGQIDAIEKPYRDRYRDTAIDRFPADLQSIARKAPKERTPHEEQLAHLVYRQVLSEYDRLDRYIQGDDKERLVRLRRELAKHDHLKPPALPLAMTVTDVAERSSPTRMPRGRRDEVFPGVPTILEERPMHVSPARIDPTRFVSATTSVSDVVATPRRAVGHPPTLQGKEDGIVHRSTTGRRSALAYWLTSPDNPLVARVMAGRVWQHYFGRSLTADPSDFGTLGGPPSHPELLDHLASRLIEDGWSLKSLHRRILLSDAYRRAAGPGDMSAVDFQRQQHIDPSADAYWRQSTRRLTAEQIRDSILCVTGGLRSRDGGPSVHADSPYRSVYVRVRRNTADPLLAAFDLPQRFNSSATRVPTTTPLQSLLLFNSDGVIRHARRLADRFSPHGDNEAVIDEIWTQVFGRKIDDDQRQSSLEFLASHRSVLEGDRPPAGESVDTAKLPFRDGRAVRMLRHPTRRVPRLAVPHDAVMNSPAFTVEAFFQLRSIADTGAVRTIVSKPGVGKSRAGWKFGVTGRGSRRKPQTLVLQAFGTQHDKPGIVEAAIFSDQHIELNTPYYAAAAVHPASDNGNAKGRVTFYLKDLSNDDEPLLRAEMTHALGGGYFNRSPLTIGRAGSSADTQFDGLIDDVRLTARELSESELFYTSESEIEDVVGLWTFEVDPGLLQDSSPAGRSIDTPDNVASNSSSADAALVDWCHVLLNSSEFLYRP